MRIASGVTDQYVYFVGALAGNRVTGLATWTVYRSRNGAAAAAMTTPTINETDSTNMPGVYELLLDEDMSIAAGNDTEAMVFHITEADMDPVTIQVELYRTKITAGNTLDVTATGAAGIDWGNVENPTTAVDLAGTDIQLVDTITTYTGNTPQTGNNFTRLGVPAGSDIAADIADVPTVAEFNARTILAASYFDPTADAVATVTNLTNLPSIPINWLTAAGVAASALNGKGDWNVGKTGYSLTQAFPTNFADMSISVTTGLVDITQVAADKIWGSATRNLTALGFILGAADLAAGTITASKFAANAIDAVAIANNAIDAGSIAAAALNGKGGWNTTTPLSAAQVNAEVDTALSDIFLDRLFAVNYDPAAKPGIATALLNELIENNGGVSRFTAAALVQVMASTLSELSSIPAATPTVGQALMLPYMSIRNVRNTTATQDTIANSAGTIIATATVSDDAVTFVKGKYA